MDGSSSAIGASKTPEVNLPFKGGTTIRVRKLTEDTTEIMPTTREVCCNKSEWPLKPSAHRSKTSSSNEFRQQQNNNASAQAPSNADQAYNAQRRAQREKLDKILDKVRRSGYASLTEEEKKELFNNSSR